MRYSSEIMKIQKNLKSLIIIISMLFIITELSNAATYIQYRSSTPYNNSITSADEEMFFTWIVIIGGIYGWWYFSRDKSRNR
ncbi:hypothetical protein CKA56_14140 [Arcobacter venerupis]|uniref:hypothetical protein n=1 Tax=Arcobacter venerupis TaxID=1054033 RepID=UPI000FEB8AD1|nr:hypothetical protein [Arcobacter venerupis]RWS48377.1 hypothetical protein CKA56_14140 [Arcobacter venerupis]